MKRTIIACAALACCAFSSAQRAETIESFISTSHEPEWYARQVEAWQEKVNADPKDQWAWRNLFRATNYHEMFTTGYGDEQTSPSADIIQKMEKAIPDSYALNLCKGRYCLRSDSAAMRGDNIYRAIDLMPEEVCAEDVNYLACRLWSIDPENPKVGELFRKAYLMKYYPARIMHYNLNMLRSMESGALYFANGDVLLGPMRMMQAALDERTDVTVIPLSYLHSPNYLQALFRRLDIKPKTFNVEDYGQYGEDWAKHFEADIIMYLMKECKRPTYFSTDILSHTCLDKDSIYNEGLLLKYSPRQYDNFSVAMKNVREVYHLEYLAEPDLVYDSWEASQRLDLNHPTLLSHMVGKFRRNGETELADRLHGILRTVVERSRIFADEESKKLYMEDFEKEVGKKE
ncbi:MAG: hypothetical protein J6I86_07550 [Bacteroidaceae bacterium]|nr:hypothetical protein [Bacteroidaceae bacterium]